MYVKKEKKKTYSFGKRLDSIMTLYRLLAAAICSLVTLVMSCLAVFSALEVHNYVESNYCLIKITI